MPNPRIDQLKANAKARADDLKTKLNAEQRELETLRALEQAAQALGDEEQLGPALATLEARDPGPPEDRGQS